MLVECTLDTVLKQEDKEGSNLRYDDEGGEAMRNAIRETRAKIEGAFLGQRKVAARLKMH